jgi:hypothetical protein
MYGMSAACTAKMPNHPLQWEAMLGKHRLRFTL